MYCSTVQASITQAGSDEAKSSIDGIRQLSAETSLLAHVRVAAAYLYERIEAEAKAEAVEKAKAAAARDLTGWVPYSTGNQATL